VVAGSVQCGECGAALVLGSYRTTICPYCACPTVVERPASPDRPTPVFVVPFTVAQERARLAVRTWSRRLRLFRRSFDNATIDDIKGIYLPAYLYSAITHAAYRAEIGENYTVTETYTTRVNGKTVTRTRTKTVTEWRPLAGEHAAYATDLVVTASRGLPNAELEHIEPFDLRGLRRYAPALVSGWLVEEPSLTMGECTELARQEAARLEEARLSAFMPGDSHRDLSFDMTVKDETIDPVLVPVWVLAVRPAPERPAVRVLVNGQSMEVWGPEKVSWVKVLLWIAALVLLVVAVILLERAP
jgi:hypothetical protein